MREGDLSTGDLERSRTLRRLGLDARRKGDHARAFEVFSAAARDLKTDATLHHEVGSAALALGRLDDARSAFIAALTVKPDLVDAIRGLGHCARREGNRSDALAYFERGAALSDDPRLKFEVAAERVAVGTPAEEAFADLLDDGRTRVRACTDLAQIARRAGNLARARGWLEEAVAVDETDRAVRHALAELSFQQWRLDEAAKFFDGLLADDPTDGTALIGRGLCARRAGHREQALAFFETAFRIDPKRAVSELARELRDAEAFDRAEDVLQHVQTSQAEDSSLLVQLGLVARAKGETDAAIALFQDAIRVAPQYLSAYLELAADQQRQGRLADAQANLKTAVALAPDHPRLLEAQGDAALATESLDAALEFYGRAAARDPAQPSSTIKLARCQAMLGRFDDALGTLEGLVARLGPSPDVTIAQAQILKDNGRAAEALATLQAGASAFPTSFAVWLQWSLLGLERHGLSTGEPPAKTPAERSKALIVRGATAAARWHFAEAQGWYSQALGGNGSDGGIRFRLAQAALANLDMEAADHHLRHLSRLQAPAKRLRGEPVGPSKSLLGQIIEEARLDPVALERILEGRDVGSKDRIEELRAVVREFPGITLPALQLLIGLRQRGVLNHRRDPAIRTQASIPRTIVQFWHAPDLPDDVRVLCDTWRELNPDHNYRRFSEREAAALLAEACPPAVTDAFRRAREPAMKADVFRLAYLAHFGGIYADVDDRCVAPVERLLASRDALVLYQEDIGSIGNNVMAAAPGHPMLFESLHRAAEAIAGGDCDIPWLATGPGLLTRVVAETVAEQGVDILSAQNVTILERRALLTTVATCCLTAYKHTRRHWSRAAFLPIGRREAAAVDRSGFARSPSHMGAEA